MKRATFLLGLMMVLTLSAAAQANNKGVSIIGTWKLYGTNTEIVFNKDGSCGGDFAGYFWYMQDFSSDPALPHWLLVYKGILNNADPPSFIAVEEDILWGTVNPDTPNKITGDWVVLETSASSTKSGAQLLKPDSWTEKAGFAGFTLLRQD